MKKLMMPLAALAALALVVPAVASAKWGRRGGKFFKKLGLSDAQREKFKELRAEFRGKAKPIREQLRAKRKELFGLWKAETPDRSAILAKMGEMSALKTQLREIRVDKKLAMRALLTPEQRAKAAEMRKRFRGRRHRWKHRRWGKRFQK